MTAKLLDPIHPGEILYEDFMKPLGVSINELAREIAVPPNRISEIVGGKRSITADTALRLGKYFGVSPEIWLGLQADYDLRVARRTTWPKAEPRVRARAARKRRRGREPMRRVAPTENDTANEVLEKRLWDAADQFRANSGLKAEVDPEEYKLQLDSRPFPVRGYKRIAVKVVDAYGNESTLVREFGS